MRDNPISNTGKKSLLKQKVEAISSNTFDLKTRILVGGRWFIECKDPSVIYGTSSEHKLSGE